MEGHSRWSWNRHHRSQEFGEVAKGDQQLQHVLMSPDRLHAAMRAFVRLGLSRVERRHGTARRMAQNN